MKKYRITYWGRRGDEGYDWITDIFHGDTIEDAIEEIIKRDKSFKYPFDMSDCVEL